MVGLHVVAAETDAEARRLFTSQRQAFASRQRGQPGPLPPPIDDIDRYWTPEEKLRASHMLTDAVVGGPEAVGVGVRRLAEATEADELVVVSAIYDHAARVRTYEVL